MLVYVLVLKTHFAQIAVVGAVLTVRKGIFIVIFVVLVFHVKRHLVCNVYNVPVGVAV